MREMISKTFDTQKAPPLLFLLVVYLIGVTTGNLGDALQAWLDPWQIALAGTCMLAAIMIAFDPIPRFINYLIGRRGVLTSTMENAPEPHRGLIVFSSIGKSIPAETSIRYHYGGSDEKHVLEKCWIVTGGAASLNVAKEMVARFVTEGFPPDLFTFVELSADDADNPAKVYEIIDGIFQSLGPGFDESDVIADYTGGTKSMTAGMVLACALPRRKLQVLKPRAYKEDGTADRTVIADPKFVDIRFKLKQVQR